MEKTTKKSKKKSRRLKKRIGIIAVGGLSFVLTICLSVGATLAWFAGSSWASNDLYMGGPVYVEMAGRGQSAGTAGDGSTTANWIGGAGNLDIKAAASRTTGTVEFDHDGDEGDETEDTIPDNVLLPGQKVQIYSQARVFSTAYTTSIADGEYANTSSGANTTNTSNGSGTATYVDGTGRLTTTTTSVLRARFSINIEFDPSVGFNNFTDENYMTNYPAQTGSAWEGALDADKVWVKGQDNTDNRRDAVAPSTEWTNALTGKASELKAGTLKSIYKWRYVSYTEYTASTTVSYEDGRGTDDANLEDMKLLQMDGVLGGSKADGKLASYACFIVENGHLVESDAFYKARTNAYLNSYVEYYENEYGNRVERTIAGSIQALDQSLNNDFKRLINDSSDDIMNGRVFGFTVNEDGVKTALTDNGKLEGAADEGDLAPQAASWLYIDPSIGNDTNTNEISTSTGGWWYLVASEGTFAGEDAVVELVTDSETDPKNNTTGENNPTAPKLTDKTGVMANATESIARSTDDVANDKIFGPKNENRLYAKLFEIDPTITLDPTTYAAQNEKYVGKNGSENVAKIVSVAFPFVNGTFALPGDALTNVFANARISFQISFQAIQAFFPYTASIDGLDYQDALFGTAKALNIKNAIPIFNEAFDYQETFTNDSGSIPL